MVDFVMIVLVKVEFTIFASSSALSKITWPPISIAPRFFRVKPDISISPVAF